MTCSHQVSGWNGFPLAYWVRRNPEVARVSVHNGADAAALGESRFGAEVGLSPILHVTIGNGIGGGLIVGGRIYRGSCAAAPEIGHLWVHDHGEENYRPIKLENLAPSWAIGLEGRYAVDRCLKGRLRLQPDGAPDWRRRASGHGSRHCRGGGPGRP